MGRSSRIIGGGFLTGLIFLLDAPLAAGDRAGTVSEQFLKIPVNARAIAMGGAGAVAVGGVSSLACNPAGIVEISGYAVASSYTFWFADLRSSFVGVAGDLGDIGTVGLGLVMLTTDDMAVTTPAYPEGTGEFFRASDYAVSIAFAKRISDKFTAGVNAKYVRSFLYSARYGASAVAFDVGSVYEISGLSTRLGVALTNLGNDVKFINETYSLPTALRFGVLVDVLDESSNKLKTSLQVSRPNDANEQYGLGAEYIFRDYLALRLGRKFGYDAENWTAGFGIRFDLIEVKGVLDYGFNNFEWLPATHSISIELAM